MRRNGLKPATAQGGTMVHREGKAFGFDKRLHFA